ncbi:uncharacterized protein MELLADRAFT_109232 [Melampsora larici-populina 98AG31]|uniref:Uncharacterized protein n=1 Tax=Melampsora larici-populina (strain 98AG31 / pathotype 3-4-7) TaxID=747676 RepID=F4RVT4_MELLP|nr:uncharacterized protein MELLADRAFT_109232 [Melampsora larici-populina 98AG31]EGG03527.1 hypothetical protein MELLADRAFT_109232 [Melampsora larici-populina 98AG31]
MTYYALLSVHLSSASSNEHLKSWEVYEPDHQILSPPHPPIQGSIVEAIKDSEVFKLMHPIVHHHRNSLSTTSYEAGMTSTMDKKRERIEKISRCKPLILYLQDQGRGSLFGRLAAQIPTITKAIEEEDDYMTDNVIALFIQLLSFDDLTLPQRLSHLAILWAFLEDSKLWNLSLIGTKIDQAPISRAVLELSFTKNFDLFAEATRATNFPNRNFAIFPEGLHRVGLLEYIRKDCLESFEIPSSDHLMTSYDDLIQSRCPLQEHIAKEITLRCIEIVEVHMDIKTRDWYHSYKMLEHLVQFIPASRKILEYSQNPLLKELLQRISRWISLRQDIDSFLSSHKVDPYISLLLSPFSKHKPVTLDHYAYIIGVFAIEEGAQNRAKMRSETGSSSKSQLGEGEALAHGNEVGWDSQGAPTLDLSHSNVEHYLPEGEELQVYLKDKSFLLNIIYRASSDIMGSKQFLDFHLQNKDNEYSVKNPQREAIKDPGGADCAICLSDCFWGQRYYEEKSSGRISCPKCRDDIRAPFRIRQHVFWAGKTTRSKDLTINETIIIVAERRSQLLIPLRKLYDSLAQLSDK